MTDIIVPLTGEIVSVPSVDLTASDEHLVALLQGCKDFSDAINSYWRDPAQEELLRRMDKRASWTIHYADHTATGRAPAPSQEWNVEELHNVLHELVSEGAIETEAIHRAIDRVVTYKPRISGINAIRKLSPEIAARIDACCSEGPQRPRRVTVKPRSLR
jgi:hypothetical protein